MARDTYSGVWNKVLLRVPSASSLLIQDWVVASFRKLSRRRLWAWRRKNAQFIMPAQYTTGTVDVTQNSTAVVGHGTTWTNAMVGRQFRTSTATPIYTITAVGGVTALTLDLAWGPVTATGVTYKIWQAYVTPPTDFLTFLTVIDPTNNWRLHLNFDQGEINIWDAMRANTGNAYIVASYDYGATGYPRYELWPHVLIDKVYPYVYTAIPADLNDPGATIPYPINGDILVELALAEAARWPGAEEDNSSPYQVRKANIYYDLNLAKLHEARAERMLADIEREDDEMYMTNLSWYDNVPFAPLPFMDASWLQRHAL